jgi:hypothetical protein
MTFDDHRPAPKHAHTAPLRERVQAWARTATRDPGRFVLLGTVYVVLVAARGVIACFPLRWITRHLGTPMEEAPVDEVPAEQLRYARRVGWAVLRATPYTPTTSNCYPQALAAWWLLHRRKIPTTFYYGAAFDESGSGLVAHVWLRCGDLMVTGGGPDRHGFAPLTWFADT